MADAASESSWTRVDRTAFEVLAIDGSASVTDEDVRAAYDEQASKATDDHQRQRLREAFQTIETEAFRAGYCLALSVFDDQSHDGFFDNAQVEPRADPVHSKGIAGILCAPDAPYARLLQAAMQVQGRFELELPQIVVCGTESQGKSSTLERIAMRDIFPRDRRFCTRLPVRLMLRTSRHQNQVTIRVKDLNTNEITRETEPQICVTGDQTDEPFSSQVSELIREFISDEHPDDKGRQVVIDREVQIEIRAPSVPTIDLVDLPGIVAAPEHARQATTHITQRMLAQEHVLVLAVVSAQSEALNSNGIWPLLHEANKPSIVVLTRVDLEGGEEDLRARLERDPEVMPDDVRIDFVVPVANRDTRKHIDMDSLRDSYTREETALRAACEMEGMEYDVTKHGMPGVLHALNEMIRAYMRDEWVDAELQRCKVAFREIFDDLLDLGTTPEAIKPEAIVSEIRKGLDVFMDMPTSKLLQEVGSPLDFPKLHELPDFVPYLRRAHHVKECEAMIRENIMNSISSSWENFKALAMHEILDKSELPLKIGRFCFVAEHIGTTLEEAYCAARGVIIEEATRCALSTLRGALVNGSDRLDICHFLSAVHESASISLVCSFSTTALSERLFPGCEFDLKEIDDVAGKRADIEQRIDAIYLSVQVLFELQGFDSVLADLVIRAKDLVDEGVPEKLGVLVEDTSFPNDLLFGTFANVLIKFLFLDAIEYAQEHMDLPDDGFDVLLRYPPAVLKLIQLTEGKVLSFVARNSDLLEDRAFLLSLYYSESESGGEEHQNDYDETKNEEGWWKHMIFEHVPKHLWCDKEMLLEAFKYTGSDEVLEYLRESGSSLLADKDILLSAVLKSPGAIKYAPAQLKTDKDIAQLAVAQGVWDFVSLPPAIHDEKKVAVAAVKTDGLNLCYLSPHLQADRKLVTHALKQNGLALEYAWYPLRDDRKLVTLAVSKNALALQYASRSLRNDRKLVTLAVKRYGSMLQYLPSNLRDNKNIVALALAKNGLALKYASETLCADRGLVKLAVSKDGLALQYASSALRDDKEIVALAMAQDGSALQYASIDLRGDKKFVTREVARNVLVLKYASTSLRRNRALVTEAVKKNTIALAFASPTLRGDSGLIELAVSKDGSALRFASSIVRRSRALVKLAVLKDGRALEYAPATHRADEELVTIAVAKNGEALQFASPALRADRQIVPLAVSKCGMALEYASTALQGNREIVLIAVTMNAFALQFASPVLQGDKEIVREAVRGKGLALEFASSKLKDDDEIVFIACEGNANAIRFASSRLQTAEIEKKKKRERERRAKLERKEARARRDLWRSKCKSRKEKRELFLRREQNISSERMQEEAKERRERWKKRSESRRKRRAKIKMRGLFS